MRLRELRLHPPELFAVLQVNRMRRACLAILSAVQPEEFSQIAVRELVITRGLVLRIGEVVQNRRKVGALLGFVTVVIAKRGEEGNPRKQGLVGLEKLIGPI